MMYVISAVMAAFLLVGCGKSPSLEKPKPFVMDQRNNLKSTPEFLFKQITDCPSKEFLTNQKNFSLSLFNLNAHFGVYSTDPYDFQSLIDKMWLRSISRDVISESHYGEEFRIENLKATEIKGPSQIDICPGVTYERNTVESAGLNVAYFINETYQAVKRVRPEIRIAPVVIKISPIHRFSREGSQDLYETDNAGYRPWDKAIIFLPHSEEFRLSGQYMSFWEVPMVSSHEYGHHIFTSIFQHKDIKETESSNCFALEHSKAVHQFEAATVSREVTTFTVLSALNEGFADLISFYTLDDDERGISGIRGLEVTRDVGSSYFADGTNKRFDEKILTDFFSNSHCSQGQVGLCIQDVHSLGAIFASSAENILSLYTFSKDKKLSIIIEWLKEMDFRFLKMNKNSPQDFLSQSVSLFYRTALRSLDQKFEKKSCLTIQLSYPGLDLPECRGL